MRRTPPHQSQGIEPDVRDLTRPVVLPGSVRVQSGYDPQCHGFGCTLARTLHHHSRPQATEPREVAPLPSSRVPLRLHATLRLPLLRRPGSQAGPCTSRSGLAPGYPASPRPGDRPATRLAPPPPGRLALLKAGPPCGQPSTSSTWSDACARGLEPHPVPGSALAGSPDPYPDPHTARTSLLTWPPVAARARVTGGRRLRPRRTGCSAPTPCTEPGGLGQRPLCALPGLGAPWDSCSGCTARRGVHSSRPMSSLQGGRSRCLVHLERAMCA